MNALNDFLKTIPPEVWSAIATALVGALISWAHANGNRIPFLAPLLDLLLKTAPKPTAAAFTPVALNAAPLVAGFRVPWLESHAPAPADPAPAGLAFHPGRRLLFAAFGGEALRAIAEERDFSDADRAVLLRVADHRGLAAAMNEDFDSQVGASAALAPPITPGKPHPLRDWLKNGGAAWIYSIAVIIAQMLGYRLPPLPPLPPMPAPAPAAAA